MNKKISKNCEFNYHHSGKDQPTVRRRGCEAANHHTGEKEQFVMRSSNGANNHINIDRGSTDSHEYTALDSSL